MKTEFNWIIENFEEVALTGTNSTKWISSKPFALVDHPDVLFSAYFHPNSESNCSGLYIEPLDFGSFADIHTRVTIRLNSAPNDFQFNDIIKTTNYTFNNKKRTGQGWPALLKNSKSAHYVRKNALHIIFQMEVLGTTPNPRADDDRYTFFNWSLNAFTKSMLPKNISDGFEWRSSSFALASAPHLKLRLVLLCKEGQDSVKLCMVPAKLKNAKVQMSYLIWVEDRNGIRLPTWVKNFTFDFNDPSGRSDTKFFTVNELYDSNFPFINRDSLQFHCEVYHDASSLVDVPMQAPLLNSPCTSFVPIQCSTQTDDWETMSVCTAIEEPIDEWEAMSVATAIEEPIDEWETLSTTTAVEEPCETLSTTTAIEEPIDEWKAIEREVFETKLVSSSIARLDKLNGSPKKIEPYSMLELSEQIRQMKKLEKKSSKPNYEVFNDDIWKPRYEEPKEFVMPELFTAFQMPPQNASTSNGESKQIEVVKPANKRTEKKTLGFVEYYMEEVETPVGQMCEIHCKDKIFKIACEEMSSKSRVFKDIVSQTKWSGKNKLVLELNSYHLFDVEELIEYLRFNEFTESYFAARGLAKMSYELKIPALKKLCTKKILQQLGTHTACEFLAFGIHYELPELVDSTVEFCAANFNEIKKLDQIFENDQQMSRNFYEMILATYNSYYKTV